MTEATLKGRVRAWLKDRIKDAEEVSLPELGAATLRHFRDEPGFAEQWLEVTLPQVAYETAKDVCATTREFVKHGDRYVDRGVLRSRLEGGEAPGGIRGGASAWEKFLEYVPAKERHIRLLEMTKPDLVSAAFLRRDRGEHEVRLGALWQELADHLGENQKVGDVFTVEAIDALEARLQIRISVGRYGVDEREAAD